MKNWTKLSNHFRFWCGMSHVANDNQFEKKGWSGRLDWSPLSRVNHYFLINSTTWTTIRGKLDNFHKITSPPSNVLSPLCVPYCCLLLLFFQSLWYCLVRGGGRCKKRQQRRIGTGSKRRQSAKRQHTPNSTTVYSFHEADWGGWSWLKSIDDVFHNFSRLYFMRFCTIFLELKDVPKT